MNDNTAIQTYHLLSCEQRPLSDVKCTHFVRKHRTVFCLSKFTISTVKCFHLCHITWCYSLRNGVTSISLCGCVLCCCVYVNLVQYLKISRVRRTKMIKLLQLQRNIRRKTNFSNSSCIVCNNIYLTVIHFTFHTGFVESGLEKDIGENMHLSSFVDAIAIGDLVKYFGSKKYVQVIHFG